MVAHATVDGVSGSGVIGRFQVRTGSVDEVDVAKISGDATAADNLELQYDTTGLTGDTFPATQAAVGNLTSGSAAINTTAKDSPAGFVITEGASEANNEDSTHALDGTTHDLEDAGPNTDAYYIFDVGGNGVPVSITWNGYAQSNGDDYAVYAYNWGGSAWEQIGSITASNGTTVVTETFDLTNAHVGTGANIGLVHFRYYSTDGTKFATDRITCSYSVVAQTAGYSLGAIWVDSAGTAGAENYVNGTADNPCPWANALTISASLGIQRFHIANGNTVTLAANSDNYTLLGEVWTLALGGQSIEGLSVCGAAITGIATATVTRPQFCDCSFGAVTIPPSVIIRCGIGNGDGLFTAGSDGQYVFSNCFSVVAGSGTPDFTFAGLGSATGINNRGWFGGSAYTLDSDCTLSHEVVGGGGQTITTAGGSAELRGLCRAVTLVLSGAGTVQCIVNAGPVTISGTATTTVNLYGTTSQAIADSSSGTTVNNFLVSNASINAEADTALSDYGPNTVVPDVAGIAAGLHSTTDGLIGALVDIDAAGIRTAVGLGSANLDTQLADLPTVAEFNARTLVAADYFDPAADAVANVTLVGTVTTMTDWADGGRLDLLLDRLITELDTATGEPGQGAPAASAKRGDKIDYLYKAWRNKETQTETTYGLYDDAGTTVDQKATVSDDGTTFTKGEVVTGP